MNPLDRAAELAMPLVAARHADALPSLAPGLRRLVCAGDGLYAQAATPTLDVSVQVAQLQTPYGKCSQHLRLINGPVPLALVSAFVDAARATPQVEVAGVIEHAPEGGYRLRMIAPRANGAAFVEYDDAEVDDDRLVVDLHSHGYMGPIFSSTDDQSDLSRRGPYLAMVVGHCHQASPVIHCRVVMPPYLVETSLITLVEQGVLA